MLAYKGEGACSDVLERYAVLMDSLKARLPYQGHIAGVGRLEPPREEGRDCISTDYTHIYQRAFIDRHTGSGRERRRASTGSEQASSRSRRSRGSGRAKRDGKMDGIPTYLRESSTGEGREAWRASQVLAASLEYGMGRLIWHAWWTSPAFRITQAVVPSRSIDLFLVWFLLRVVVELFVVLGPRRQQREQQRQQGGITGTSVAPPEGAVDGGGEVKSVVGVVSGADQY